MNKKLFIFIFGFLLINCSSRPGEAEYKEIMNIPVIKQDERSAKFLSYPVDTQISIYLYAEFYVEGGNYLFLNYIKKDGENKILQISQRIAETENPVHKYFLIGILDEIDENCTCVADNSIVLDRLIKSEMKVDLKKDDPAIIAMKDSYKSDLKKITSGKRP